MPVLRLYWLSKWTCPVHGKFTAKTANKVDPARRQISCPECVVMLQFDGQCKGHTAGPLPLVSKPRIPAKEKVQPVASDNRPLTKRGKSW